MRLTKLLCFVLPLVLFVDCRTYGPTERSLDRGQGPIERSLDHGQQLLRRSVAAEEGYAPETKYVAIRDVTRQRRGLAGLIVSGTLTAVTVLSTGFQLWTAITKGCNIQPSICTDKDKIIKYEGEIDTLTAQYDALFEANQWRYLNIKLCMINNQYILSYIDDQFRKVDAIGTQIEIIVTKLETDLKTMEKMFAGNESKKALENLLGPFEYELENIKKRIEGVRTTQIVGLVVQRSLEIFLGGATAYVNKVVTNAKGDNLAEGDSVINRISSDNADLPAPKQSFWQKTKNYFSQKGNSLGFAFNAIADDIKIKFTQTIPDNIKSWWTASKKWSTFKTKVKATFLSPTSTITKVKNFLKSPGSSIKYAAKDYTFSAGGTFVKVLSAVADGIQNYIQAKEWEKVAKEISDSRKAYETFIAKAKEALKELNNETITLGGYWSNTINDFKSLVTNFTNVTTLARENQVFADIAGLTGLPVDTSHDFFKIDFDAVTEKNLKEKQEVVKGFFDANGKSLSDIHDKFKIQQILVTDTKELASQNNTINYIYESLKRSFKNYDSGVMKNYSSEMVEKDVVCSASLVLPDISEYDFYPTETFRSEKCNISDAAFTVMQESAAQKRDKKFLHDTINSKMPNNTKPSNILDLAKAKYSGSTDLRLKTFGANLKEKDVVCEIATLYPELNSYSLYDLTAFRPECSQVTDSQFIQIKNDVVAMENAKQAVDWSMTFCLKSPVVCQCPSVLTGFVEVTEAQINILIDEFQKANNLTMCNYVEVSEVCSFQC